METVRHAHHLHLLQAQDAEQADHEGGGGHGHTAARGHGAESHVTRSRCCHDAVTPCSLWSLSLVLLCTHCPLCCSFLRAPRPGVRERGACERGLAGVVLRGRQQPGSSAQQMDMTLKLLGLAAELQIVSR